MGGGFRGTIKGKQILLDLGKKDKGVNVQMDTTKKKTIIGIVIAVVILCLVGAGIAVATTTNKKEEGVTFNINAENWTDESSPMIAHIQGTTTEQEQIDFYHAFTQSGEKTIELVDGDYTLSWVSAINKDGSIYNVPDKIEFKVENGTYVSESNFNYISADKVTSADMNKVLDEIKEAVKKGDESLTGDNAKQVVEQASTNAKTNPNVDKKQIEQKQQEAEKVATEKKEATSTGTQTSSSGASATTSGNSGSSSASTSGASSSSASSDTGSSASTPASSDSSSSSSSGGSSSSTPSSSDSGSSSGGSATPAEPVHTHSWQAQYTTQQTPIYETQDVLVCKGCGARGIDYEHSKAHMLAHEKSATYVDEVDVLVGYNTEQILTGYVCTGCGATR